MCGGGALILLKGQVYAPTCVIPKGLLGTPTILPRKKCLDKAAIRLTDRAERTVDAGEAAAPRGADADRCAARVTGGRARPWQGVNGAPTSLPGSASGGPFWSLRTAGGPPVAGEPPSPPRCGGAGQEEGKRRFRRNAFWREMCFTNHFKIKNGEYRV